MQARQTTEPQRPQQPSNDALIQRRTELEARLLAYRCGWRAHDEMQVVRLTRALARVLDELGQEDRQARALVAGSGL